MYVESGKNDMNLLVARFRSISRTQSPSQAGLLRSMINDDVNDPSSSMIRRANVGKKNKYKERAEANDVDFMPMALECYGALSKECVDVMQMLRQKPEGIGNHWLQQISSDEVLLQTYFVP